MSREIGAGRAAEDIMMKQLIYEHAQWNFSVIINIHPCHRV